MLFAESAQDMRNGHVSSPRRTCDRQAITPSARPAGCQHRTVHLNEHLSRMVEKEAPSARQPHPSFAAVKQPDLNLFLQLFDLLTEGRRRDVESVRGVTEM